MATQQLVNATLEVIGRQKSSKYQDKPDYRPVLFTLPGGEKRWKSYNVGAPELVWLTKGKIYQAVVSGNDFNIIQPDDTQATQAPVSTKRTAPDASAPVGNTPQATEFLSKEQKQAIAAYVSGQADLLAYCWQQAEAKLPGKSEESHRCTASSLFIAAQRKFSL